ncbi:uncharacterized protein LOC135471536 [Liolophura sinensis]|uniref:uncharacterized protein LOC135471536 n=1 Tax=Liolophura sinensis TaxID=3198878 RepID=UPI0031586051
MAKTVEMAPVLAYLVTLAVVNSLAADITMDFANANDCTRYHSGPIQLTPDDVVYADVQGRQTKFGGPLECIMRFTARERSRGLRLFTKHFNINDCGVTLEVYDQNVFLQTPKWIFDCYTSSNEVYVLEGGEMTLRLGKISTASHAYQFNIQITTNDSPRLEYPQEVYRPGSRRNTLTEGAMIGISISCIIGGGVVIVVIVFLVVKLRKRRRESRHEQTDSYGKPLPNKY